MTDDHQHYWSSSSCLDEKGKGGGKLTTSSGSRFPHIDKTILFTDQRTASAQSTSLETVTTTLRGATSGRDPEQGKAGKGAQLAHLAVIMIRHDVKDS